MINDEPSLGDLGAEVETAARRLQAAIEAADARQLDGMDIANGALGKAYCLFRDDDEWTAAPLSNDADLPEG